MSTEHTDRWFIVPPAERPDPSTPDEGAVERYAKYSDEPGLTDTFAIPTLATIIKPLYTGHFRKYPDYEEWFVVRYYGDAAVLDNIADHDDTQPLSGNPNHISRILNSQFAGSPHEYDHTGWFDRFRVGSPADD